MIPLKLTLHNFMCYRNTESLDLRGLHLACLTGDNGHGKSALLDAMTWVLWGRARSNSADDLIHLGQTEMWVELEFALGPNRYRVLRRRQRRGRGGKSDLQLQVWFEQDGAGEFRPITEPTIRETERRIVELLRMDYDTFINSAFLMQGRADEFTVKPPNQRKQILADILGLSIYDEYEARARERARQRREEAGRVEAQIAAIDEELARKPEYQAALQEAQEAVTTLSEQLRAAEQIQQTLYVERQELLAQRRSLDDLERRLEQGRRQLAEVEAQLERDHVRLATAQALVEQRDEIEAGYGRLVEARQADQAWNEKLAAAAALQAQRGQLEGQIMQARNRLETERRVAVEARQRLETQVAAMPDLQQQLSQARQELAHLAELDQQRAGLQAQLQALREEYATLRADNQRITSQQEEIREKLALLAEEAASCPVCGQPLGQEERQQVRADYRQQDANLQQRLQANEAALQELTARGQAMREALQAAEQELATRSRWQRREAQAEAQLAEAEKAQAALADVLERLAAIDARLAAADYAQKAQAELAQIDQQIAALGYDAALHRQTQEVLAASEAYQERYSQLQSALDRLQDLQSRIRQAEAARQHWLETLADDQARSEELATAVARLPQVEAELRKQTSEVERLAEAESRARQLLGAAQQRLDACRAQARQREQLAAQLADLLDQQAVYEELQAAFGKKGLQAMIIEAALPEIEAEANRLLNRMTGGRMTVRMETQRETKTTQELRETLDIILADELGSRDYALFSGGEAFRANFAIRVALSKLLARRAGARLQTLIVDEGFGTQDAQGRERLVEAINAIQDDFECVLVITHIEELKDHFPARIDVVKTPDGSQISVN